jgi:hypothetical protein
VPDTVVTQIQGILSWPATREQIQRAKHQVALELVERVIAGGTPAEARNKVAEYQRRGCTCPGLYPVRSNVELLIETFAPNVGGETRN